MEGMKEEGRKGRKEGRKEGKEGGKEEGRREGRLKKISLMNIYARILNNKQTECNSI
jgi:flagellar biosynthesis/type III secretory pathway protein FliH